MKGSENKGCFIAVILVVIGIVLGNYGVFKYNWYRLVIYIAIGIFILAKFGKSTPQKKKPEDDDDYWCAQICNLYFKCLNTNTYEFDWKTYWDEEIEEIFTATPRRRECIKAQKRSVARGQIMNISVHMHPENPESTESFIKGLSGDYISMLGFFAGFEPDVMRLRDLLYNIKYNKIRCTADTVREMKSLASAVKERLFASV